MIRISNTTCLFSKGWQLAKADDRQGFTILEVSLILIVAGLILAMASAGWNTFLYGRRVAAVRNLLRTADNCVMKFVMHSGRIPGSSYFNSRCTTADPWGRPLIFLSSSSGSEINCGAGLGGTKKLHDQGFTAPEVAWIITSSGPDRTFNFIDTTGHWNFSNGDDIYVYATAMELQKRLCE